MTDVVPTLKIKSSHPASQGDFVEINASDFDGAKHELFDVPPPPPAPPVPLPPPPGVPDPLAALGADWRKRDDLRQLAASVSGRSVENKAQAIAVIEAELAKRTK